MSIEAIKQALEACPFCGGDAEYQKENVRSGYGEYERNETYHTIRCKKCGSSSKRIHQKHLIDFTKYTVSDFRWNPILRAKVEDDYDAYCEQSKQLAIDAWNLRQAIEQAEKQETVAVWELFADGWDSIADPEWMESLPVGTKLYTIPQPQREWVGLTDEEIALVCSECAASAHNWNDISFARAIEAKLKEKNT